ncbi:MAG: ABC transporter permease [Negativicoccus succinicivorans]|uniref:Toluene tolerance ABC efflux transporter, permease n=1 Tax=Negativicoccus succinicivorans DORA_17_25 TaxID=1403945 RepID=W1TYB1_9FIRM|nr:ABC transporter permease [Negativicoccus succinicivorans]ETI86320.1 MAG: Toluene tolerance ABC efflux transporter, permease [Negativicoccus succinicivorans DORA_17_25]MBS5890413.1 ABC transporter permease [Negativicoccus succinicivorans]MBS5917635.1 ABC transporter permease [Negativicoccus succinicivorans]MBS6028480.1 ABC transporter permease [Negativicoccus succinicivorans]MDU0986695.1 ABC transporter permease [Negativicoccus succinicivorans]
MNELLTSLGRSTIYVLAQIGAAVQLLIAAWQRITSLNMRQTTKQMALLGVGSFPIVALTLLFTGMVLTLQIATELSRFGAQFSIGAIVSLGLGRELGPVLCGVVLAGRGGAAITAEIGTMKVTEQIDALRVLATDPISYLVVPRMAACMIMLPLLNVLGLIIGTFGGVLVCTLNNGISAYTFWRSIEMFVTPSDVYLGMIKAVVFGMIVAVVGCSRGMLATAGAEGVGKAATETVVYSIMMIFAVNYLLSSVLF